MARFLLLLLAFALTPSLMAVEKKPAIGGFPFWSAPKREFSDQFVPGLNAALLLSPEQIEQLHAARRETIDSETLRAATRKDPNLTEAQREAANKLVTAAQANLRIKVSNILTVEQRDLIERINALHQEVEKAVLDEFQPKLTASKGDEQAQERLRTEMRERKLADLRSKLESLLSPNQKSAFDQAAAAGVEAAQKGKK